MTIELMLTLIFLDIKYAFIIDAQAGVYFLGEKTISHLCQLVGTGLGGAQSQMNIRTFHYRSRKNQFTGCLENC